jgi:hypothetical protein
MLKRRFFTNLALVVGSLLMTLLIIDALAPALTNMIASAQRDAALKQAVADAAPPLDASQLTGATTDPTSSSSPQAEFMVRGGGPAWGEATGWGTNTDAVLHYWLEGVYDTRIEYNSQGYRGDVLPYEKPADVYRILILGDSFIEAREVAYEDTIYAQLGALLKNVKTPAGKKIEVLGVGATGWGTIQQYLYYHHEGYKYAPDLIISLFVMNDVVDNNPRVFYADRTLDFAVTEDSITLIKDGAADGQTAAFGLDALPPFFAQSNTARLLRQIFAPPREAVAITGNLAKLHPQTYLYVLNPEIAGYPEGWRRTESTYRIWADEAHTNNARLMVLQVDVGVERITELSTYFRATAPDWIWDVDLPTRKLHAALDPLNVPLIETRTAYEDFAASVGLRPFDALFYVADGHWNPTGHRITAELLAETLQEQAIISAN